MKIEIKVKNPCAAVKFFGALNPFMFIDAGDNYLPSYVQKHPQFFFMDPITGNPQFVIVDLPESVYFQRDELAIYFEQKSTDRTARYEFAVAGVPLPIIEHTLELEAIRIDGDEYPGPDRCRCPVISLPGA